MKIAILGKGNVGETLGGRWATAGHEIIYGSRNPNAENERTAAEAVVWADVAVLCTPWAAVSEEYFAPLAFDGKVLIDCTNPIKSDFSGIEVGSDGSGGEKVARLAPSARVVKAFNSIGSNVMADPSFHGSPTSLLIAGDDPEARSVVASLAKEIGFAPEDAGPLEQSRYIEALAWLWISMALKYGLGREIVFNLAKR